jgi:hypothetical protein
MKKLFLFVLLVALAASFSCQKTEEKEFLKQETLLMNLTAPSQKTSETNSISNGDTIEFHNVFGFQFLLSAASNGGNEVRGIFNLFLLDGDYHIDGYQFVGLENIGQSAYDKTLFAFKLPVLGLYQLDFFPKSGYYEPVTFYIRHMGLPGEIGDDLFFDYSFRLDKKFFQVDNNSQKAGYIMYIKGEEDQFPGQEFSPQGFLYCENFFYITPNGQSIPGRNFQLQKSKYSQQSYYYFAFLEEECPPTMGDYRMYFYSGDLFEEWWLFPAVEKSDFVMLNQIVVKLF